MKIRRNAYTGAMNLLSRLLCRAIGYGLVMMATAVCFGIDEQVVEQHAATPPGEWQLDRADLAQLDGVGPVLQVVWRGAPELSRFRFFIDVDGPGQGVAPSGADYMLEGCNWYQHIGPGQAWNWKMLGPAQFLQKDHTVFYTLPPGLSFDTAMWLAETTTPDWKTACRVPEEGLRKVVYTALPALDISQLEATVSQPGLDLLDITPVRITDSDRVGFSVDFGGKPMRDRLRIMVDVDGLHKGLAGNGYDYMLEGGMFYRHNADDGSWNWKALGQNSYVEEDKNLVVVLPVPMAYDRLTWAAETFTTNWTTAKRFPVLGQIHTDMQQVPSVDIRVQPDAVDLSELLAYRPKGLSTVYDKQYDKMDWTPVDGDTMPPPAWKTDSGKTVPLVFTVLDAVTGESAQWAPVSCEQAGNSLRWRGAVLGIDCELIAKPAQDGKSLLLTGRLQADRDRCIHLKAGCQMALEGLTWHDDVRKRRLMNRETVQYANCGPGEWGLIGEQSLYPYGVVSDDRQGWMIETDPYEPRIFQITAEPALSCFGVGYDLALTEQTKKFPGQATFRFTLRVVSASRNDAFREATAGFYRRYPDFYRARTERAGLWMPFFNISALSNFQDFGFAFHEGPNKSEYGFLATNNIYNFVYTEPWLYWLKLPREESWNPTDAFKAMQWEAKTGKDKKNRQAASALQAAVRDADGKISMTFMRVPWNAGARMEVSTDPELGCTAEAPLNRAMAEWADIEEAFLDDRVDGVYFDSMQSLMETDYNPAALAVADYPATYNMKDLCPGLAGPVAAYEFTAMIGRYLHARGKLLMGNFPCWNYPFFMAYIDVPGEETTWLSGGKYHPMADRQLTFRRMISGAKPFGFLQATRFEAFKGPIIKKYFEACLFQAFLPSFFSHDGANDPYWVKPEWYDRDRPLFKTYVPLIQRLAQVGWEPVSCASLSDRSLWLEQFGRSDAPVFHITIRNESTENIYTECSVRGLTGPCWLVNPLTGSSQPLVPGDDGIARADLCVPGETVQTYDLIRPEGLAEARRFADSWQSGDGESRSYAASLDSIQREDQVRVTSALKGLQPPICGQDNAVTLQVANRGDSKITVSKVRLTWPGGATDSGSEILTVPAGRVGEVRLQMDVPDSCRAFPVQVAWTLRRDDKETQARLFLQLFPVPAIDLILPFDRGVCATDDMTFPVTIQNNGPEDKTVSISWEYNDVRRETEQIVPARGTQSVLVSVSRDDGEQGGIMLKLKAGDDYCQDRRMTVQFMKPGESLARDSRVQVTVDGSYGGYTTIPLNDGVTDPKGMAWNEAAWASAESANAHWVQYAFPLAVTAQQVVIHWNREGGDYYTSRKGEIRGVAEDGRRVTLGRFENIKGQAVTVVNFEPQALRTIELWQAPRGGSEKRPDLLWLRELEVFSGQAGSSVKP